MKRVLAQGKYIRLVEEDGWEYSERVGASGVVVIVPVTAEGELVMVEQYRMPLKSRVLELPAGLVGDIEGSEDESLETAASRELEEETGFKASSFKLLANGPSAAGSSTTLIHFYLATGMQRTGPGGGDPHEDIEVHVVPLASAEAFIDKKAAEGRMIDPKIYAGLHFARAAAR